MKTKDFVNYIEARGGYAEILDHYVNIWGLGGILATVDSDRAGKLKIEDCDRLIDNNMLPLIAEYCTTPIYKREEEKKYWIPAFDGVLNVFRQGKNKAFFANKAENDSIKTKFTDQDIEELKKRDDIPLDWGKVKLEDAD